MGASPLTRLASRRWLARARLAEHPALYLPLARRKYPESVLGEETELVIDGFTRSAVTFATIAFQIAQPRPVRVAHTLHAAGHVLAATARGVPTMVAIREPRAAVLSAVVREPHVLLAHALIAYARFYETVTPRRDRLVVAPFDDITHDLGAVIARVNDRFGTSFARFEHSEENVRATYEVIEHRAAWPPWSAELGRFESGIIGYDEYRRVVERFTRAGARPAREIPEHRVQRPSETRERQKDELRAELERPDIARLLERATRAHARFTGP
jgi:hypothetical protein